MSIAAFGEMLAGMGSGCIGVGKALAKHLDIPFYEDRHERKLGHCLQEKLNTWRRRSLEECVENLLPEALYRFGDEPLPVGEVEMRRRWDAGEEFPEQLTEEVWTHDHYPDSYNGVAEAVSKVPNGILGVYYHGSSMNLVLIASNGEKVGIKSIALLRSRAGLEPLGQLKKAVLS